MHQQIAQLTIVDRGHAISYRLTVDGRLVWATRSAPTDAGRDGARERMRAWLKRSGYRVELAQDGTQQHRRAS